MAALSMARDAARRLGAAGDVVLPTLAWLVFVRVLVSYF